MRLVRNRVIRKRAASLIAAFSLAAQLSSLSACFSDRTTVTGTDGTSCNVQLPSDAFGSAVVVIKDFAFSPAQVHIKAGAKVTWVNCGAPGSDSHTSTADGGKWRSALLAPGATFTTQIVTAGVYSYHCEPHPGMTGTVFVE